MVKHVYLLGAGFSVPLGGPLFTDLLSLGLSRKIDYFLSKRKHKSAQLKVIQVFPEIIHQILQGAPEGQGISLNAEQILETAEALKENRMNWFAEQLFSSVMSHGGIELPDNGTLNQTIVKLLKARIAIEANHFMTELHDSSERWDPFFEWYKTLGTSDHIITTNYDLVLEKLERRFREIQSLDLSDLNCQREVDFKNREDGPTIAKIHGSCNWFVQNDKLYQDPIFDPFGAQSKDIAIGTPGNSKTDLAHGLLNPIWESSIRALKQAHVISIVGYSLPETDNRFRYLLLDCIASNSNLKAVNIILGPRSERGIRARSIIRQVLLDRSETKVYLPTIYAQDFLPNYRPRFIDDIEAIAFDD